MKIGNFIWIIGLLQTKKRSYSAGNHPMAIGIDDDLTKPHEQDQEDTGLEPDMLCLLMSDRDKLKNTPSGSTYAGRPTKFLN